MKERCFNKNATSYKYYGARGITVCSAWCEFEPFYIFCTTHGWQHGLDIDRRDNNKGYEPDNCRFITPRNNHLNRRRNRTNTSGYVGVVLDKRSNKWSAQIKIKGLRHYLGYYKEKEDAVKARNAYIINNNIQHEYVLQRVEEAG